MISTTSSVRVQVRNLLVLHRAGRHEEALQGAVRLAEQLHDSALVLNLLGDLQMEACFRTRDSSSQAARDHGMYAVGAYKSAAAAAPNCLKTSAAYLACLSEMKLLLEADEEMSRVEQLKLLLEADEEMSRVEQLLRGEELVIDDPQIHHVAFDLTDEKRTKEYRIENAIDDFTFIQQKFNLETDRESNAIEQVLCTLQTSGAHCAAAAATNIATSYATARSQLLLVYMQIEQVRTLSPHDKLRRDILEQAVEDTSKLTNAFPNSLLFSVYYTKLLIITGRYVRADIECRRALCISEPQLPKVDPVPLWLFSVKRNGDIISAVKNEISALQKLVSTQLNWSMMTSHQRESLISVKAEMLIEHFSSASSLISGAIEHFKRNSSWDLYICPVPESECRGFYGVNAIQLSHHISRFHSVYCTEMPTASSEEISEDTDLFNVLSLRQDSQKQDIICFRSLEAMYEVLLLTSTVEPPSPESLRLKLCREAAGILEGLTSAARSSPSIENKEFTEQLQMKLFRACILDYRLVLLPWVSLLKMEEIEKSENVYSYSLDDFDWAFSREKVSLEKLKNSDSTNFRFVGDVDWMEKEPSRTYPPTFDLLGNLELTPSEQEEPKQNYQSGDLPSSFDSTFSSYVPAPGSNSKTGIKEGEFNRSYGPTFDLLGDLDMISIEHKPSSVGILENPSIQHEDETFDFVASLGWDVLIDEPLKSSNADSDQNEGDGESSQDAVAETSKVKKKGRQASQGKGPGQIHNHAWLYQKFRSERSEPPSNTDKDWRTPFDPYGLAHIHEKYHSELTKKAPKHLCSVCYFEKANDVEVDESDFTHYIKQHGRYGIKCNECPARFILQSALDSHQRSCHQAPG